MPDIDDIVTSDRILAICPKARADIVETIVTDAPVEFTKHGLTSLQRISHFFAQIATETGGLRRLDENMNYTSAARLCEIWPSKFPNEAAAKPFVKNPVKLANFVYGTKNGNKGGNDGWNYRGSGLIQITGRENYHKAGGQALEDKPDLAREPDAALAFALGYWSARKINEVADGASEGDVDSVTKRVNPAMIGRKERRDYFKKALNVFGSAIQAPVLVAAASVAAPAAIPGAGKTLSGAIWVSRFPTSRDLAELNSPFREGMTAFVDALRQAGADVRISATWRPRERAYLMHWSWRIAREGIDPAGIPPLAGVLIEWDHGTPSASRKAAKEMVAAYGMVHRAALNSRHTERAAVDMTIAWNGTLAVRQADGTTKSITSTPRNGSNPDLVRVGAGYGAIKLLSDPPHWSDDGR